MSTCNGLNKTTKCVLYQGVNVVQSKTSASTVHMSPVVTNDSAWDTSHRHMMSRHGLLRMDDIWLSVRVSTRSYGFILQPERGTHGLTVQLVISPPDRKSSDIHLPIVHARVAMVAFVIQHAGVRIQVGLLSCTSDPDVAKADALTVHQ